jgi:hypothetical protein
MRDSVKRHAAHGNAALAVARRQRQLQLAAGYRGVVIKKLVKVAHAKEQQRIGILLFRRGPLAHKRRELRGVLLRLSFFGERGSERKLFLFSDIARIRGGASLACVRGQSCVQERGRAR